jgi:hypothetical protein
MATDAEVVALIAQSPLRHYDWPHRGTSPPAYLEGLILAFARAHAMLASQRGGAPLSGYDAAAWSTGRAAVATAVSPVTANSDHDVLAYYAAEVQRSGATVGTPGERLVAVFSIMTGLGMRESSGRYCAGADTEKSRGEPTTPKNAESGLFQVSWDSINGDADRQAMFLAFKSRTDLLDVFRRNVAPKGTDMVIHGEGDQAAFQTAMKNAPLFATLYTARFLRQRRGHWGPINTKRAEVRADAVALFSDALALLAAG